MDLQLNGKRALVVGASRGLGRSIALGLAREGVCVTALARGANELEILRNELPKCALAPHKVVATDLMQEGEPQRIAKELLVAGECPEIVVYNIGGSLRITDPFAEAASYAQVWRLNVGIPVDFNSILLPELVKRGSGRIVHVSSAAAETLGGYVPYASAKAALNAYFRALSRTVAKDNVIISGVAPGAIFESGRFLTELQKKNNADWQEYCKHHLPIGRVAAPEEILPFVLLLCSPLATYSSGALIGINGGSA